MAFPFKVVVYINGVRFDVRSASYTAEDGGDYHFSVDVPAVPEWDILPERSHGALFFTDPVTQTWRFMGEGEYVSTSKSKSPDGARSRSLYFRGIHGWWNQASYVSVMSLNDANRTEGDFVNQTVLLRAFGQDLRFTATPADATFRISSLNDLLTVSLTGTDGLAGAVSAFVPKLIRNIALQTPVEAFYLSSRKLANKMFAFPDKQIETIVDINRYNDIIKNGTHAFGLGPSTPLDQILRMYEDLIFYKRVPLPAPFQSGSNILELMWVPHLYSVMTPVCNVFFDAQMIMQSEQRSFMTEPTRAVAQVNLTLSSGNEPFPFVYMANQRSVYTNQDLTTNYNAKTAPIVSTHDLLSPEELLKGVIPTSISLGLEKIINTSQTTSVGPNAKLADFIESGVKHQYFIERSRARSKDISSIFLPYSVPGFPCLCEDKTGPVFGVVASITHSMPASGKPTSSIRVSHVRPAFRLSEDKSPVNPPWLNEIFLPAEVEGTFKDLLGILPSNIGKATNPSRSSTSIMQGSGNPDQDAAAAEILAIPTYTDALTAVSDGYSVNTISKQLALKPDPALAYLQFQYREGMSLSQYITFHGLSGTANDSVPETSELPADLSPSTNQLFASPNGLQYVGIGGGNSIYGIYNIVGGLNPLRQNASRTIAAAIAKILTAN